VHVLDDKSVRRRFRASNFQAVTRVKPFITTMPLRLDDGWNQLTLNMQVGGWGGGGCWLGGSGVGLPAWRGAAHGGRSTAAFSQCSRTSAPRHNPHASPARGDAQDLCKRAYGTNFVETLRVQIHANCRVRRVYFSDRPYGEEELPAEFRLYVPLAPK